MNHIKPFNVFSNVEKIEEGALHNIAAGLLSLLAGFSTYGQSPVGSVHNKDGTTTSTIKRTFNVADVSKQEDLKSLLKSGWKQTYEEMDTLFEQTKIKAPNTEVHSIQLNAKKDELFESGKFQVSENLKKDIDSVLSEILSEDGVLTKINLTSSTDKQQIGSNLQKILSDSGYSPDNQGLSNARSENLKKYIVSKDINDSLISIFRYKEQGDTVDQSARYVTIDIFYLVQVAPQKEDSFDNTQVKKTVYLQKTFNKQHKEFKFKTHINFPHKHYNLGKVGKHHWKSLKCPRRFGK